MSKVMLMLGTRKGAFLAFSEAERRRWELAGPFLKGVEVNHMSWASGKIVATVKSYWWGPDVRTTSDFGETWKSLRGNLPEGCTRPRVLVAEDNPVNQEVVLATLRDAGVAADLAENGAEAVAMAGRVDYDMILMDMQMPVMDGLEATRALRATPRNGRTCIIAMTANAFDEDRRRCLAAGMDGYLAKPVAPDDLVAAMLRWIPVKPGPAARGAPPALAPAAETAALDRLEALLAADDMAATRACRELAPHLRACLGDRVDSFEREVGAFDFQAALATLRAARRMAAAEDRARVLRCPHRGAGAHGGRLRRRHGDLFPERLQDR